MRIATIILALVAAPVAAHAQVMFPGDDAYRPLHCGDGVMSDGFADESGALNERDIVGDDAAPAGLRASDATNLYLRLRLEEDPAPGGALRQFTWGMEIDLDNDVNDYELLVLVGGIGGAGSVELFTNTTTTVPNDPNDPADEPAAQTYTFANNGRSAAATGSNFGGSGDFFLDFAVPWSALIPLGLDHDTPIHVWAASSSSPNSLNGDFACHVGGSGPPTLSDTASAPTTGDPNDPGAGGGTGQLEGGGGCAAGGGDAKWMLALALLGFVRRRRA